MYTRILSTVRPSVRSIVLLTVLSSVLVEGLVRAEVFSGRLTDAEGSVVVGALVTFAHGDPTHTLTVYSDSDGSFRTPELGRGPWSLRVRRVGWRDLVLDRWSQDENSPAPLVMIRETDPAAVAAQLPSNRWYALLLESIEDEGQREELVRTCTYCHQQGNWATRVQRSDEQWDKVLSLMGRMGAGLSPELRERIPGLFNTAYDPTTAVPRLTAGMNEPGFAPPPERIPGLFNTAYDPTTAA